MTASVFIAEPTIEDAKSLVKKCRDSEEGFYSSTSAMAALVVQLAERIEKLEELIKKQDTSL